MTTAPASTPNPKPRWYHLTPDRFILGLLLVEGCLLLSERFGWFSFNERKGMTLLIAVGVLAVALLILLSWFIAALLLRRRFQYGLRSLLVLTVVVAGLCSWFAVKKGQARRQREAVAAIQKIDGLVFYDSPLQRKFNRPSEILSPEWLRKILGQDFSDDVQEVNFNYSYSPLVTDAVLANVEKFDKIKWIYLPNAQVTEKMLVHFYGLKNLETIFLKHASVTKDDEKKLKEVLPTVQFKREKYLRQWR